MSKYSRPSILPHCLKRPAVEAGRAAPGDGVAYRVKDGDSWVSLAREWGMDPWSLINYNFRTYDPKEVNWYLQEYVGCTKPTADRKNWCFSSSAQPGVIYRPIKQAPLPPAPVPMPMPLPPMEEDDFRPGTGGWLGIGVKGGGHVVLGGADTATVFAFSIDDPRRWVVLQVSMGRLGPGLGASGSLVVVGIANCFDPYALRGFPLSGGDFQLAVGGKWGALLKTAGRLGNLVETVKAGRSAKHLINAAAISLAKRQEIINDLKNSFGALGILKGDGDYGMAVNVVDTPLGAGAELSIYYSWGSVALLQVNEPGD
jgi:hypothetical protein